MNYNINFDNSRSLFKLDKKDQDFRVEEPKTAGNIKTPNQIFQENLRQEALKKIDMIEKNHPLVVKQRNLNETELAYIAGFLDGDGTIQISTASTERQGGYVYPFKFQLNVAFIQLAKRQSFLIDLQQKFGNKGNIRKKTDTVSELVIGDTTVIKELLELLLPYLRTKKRQAAIALLIIDHIQDPANCNNLTCVEYLRRAKLVDELSFYNDGRKRTNTSYVIKQKLISLNRLTQQDLQDSQFIE
jgi:hypothetical protein